MAHLHAIGFALVAALCIALSAVMRHWEAARVPDLDLGRLGAIGSLVHRPLWWFGTAVGAGGYVFQAMALGRGSVLLVQSLLVSSLLFALPLAATLSGRAIRRSEWLWALVLSVAIVVLLIVGDPRQGKQHVAAWHWALTAAIGVPLFVACLLGARQPGRRRALLLGIAAGALFGLAAVLTKGVVTLIGEGAAAVFGSAETYALVVVGVAAVVLQQDSYQAGALQASLPAATVTEPVVAAALGILLLDEYFDVDGAHVILLALALTAMTAATLALARSAASEPAPAPTPIR
ncbi:hypothetical protein SAMN04244553_3014 [Nocardia amikacinitolerans]|uniref:Magnesium transporter NIPA n=1 Tax=Nocardia amikacinitolerans TaxID=756689 RepID=A0A285L8Z6_9NOCA|nr:DMT family transporter [Nocardia amikacinitolerans]SNY81420.1 hypothetical protein SAMN04244553_3014 [Nocardia amikacinitolerans]